MFFYIFIYYFIYIYFIIIFLLTVQDFALPAHIFGPHSPHKMHTFFYSIRREIRRLLKQGQARYLIHPRSVGVIKMEGKRVDEITIKGVNAYFAIYIVCLAVIFLLICFEPFGLETNLTAAVSCFNNVGPGLGWVGPAYSYSAYTDFSKVVLSFAMLLGRLEIYPLILAFMPSTWSKRS